MKNPGFNMTMRIISVIILISIVVTSATFTTLAAEVLDTIIENDTQTAPLNSHQSDASFIADNTVQNNNTQNSNGASDSSTDYSGDISDYYYKSRVPGELIELLGNIDNIDKMSEADRKRVLEYIGMGYDEKEINIQKAKEAAKRKAFENTVSKSIKAQSKILELSKDNKSYSELSSEDKAIILYYLNIDETNIKSAEKSISKFEKEDMNLSEIVFAMQIISDGIFDYKDAITILNLYPERYIRNKQVKAFKSFISFFDLGEETSNNDLITSVYDKEMAKKNPKTDKAVKKSEKEAIKAAKKEYINNKAFKNAKSLFLEGYSAEEIEAAYSIAASLDENPAKLIKKASEINTAEYSAAEIEFIKNNPINLSNVYKALEKNKSKSSSNEDELMQLENSVMMLRNALYSEEETRDEVIRTDITPPFSDNISDRENISLNTGAVNYSESLISLPGMGENDYNFGIRYNSANSNLDDPDYFVDREYAWILTYDVTPYFECGDIVIDGDPYRVEESFDTKGEAEERWDELCDIEGEYVLFNTEDDELLTIAYEEAENEWDNYYLVKWAAYPDEWEEIYRDDSPAPDSLIIYDEYSDYSYAYGELNRDSDECIYDSGQYLTDDYYDGYEVWAQHGHWKAYYSGDIYYYSREGYCSYSKDGIEKRLVDCTYENVLEPITHEEDFYNIGSGWSFNTPSLDIANRTIILPGQGTYAYDSDMNIEDYMLRDMTFSKCSTYNNGQYNSKYCLEYLSGYKYYFNFSGRIIGEVDKYDNEIIYKYTPIDGELYPSEIIDTAGRSINIVYSDTSTGKCVSIIAPDQSITRLHTKNLGDEGYGVNNYILDRIEYPSGEVTSYEYLYPSGRYNLFSRSTGDCEYFRYALLSTVRYNTGAELNYMYDKTTVRLGDDGRIDIYRIAERNMVYDSTDNRMAERKEYSYFGDYTDYNPESSTPHTYDTYVMEITSDYFVCHRYVFNDRHLCIKEYINEGVGSSEERTKYIRKYYGEWDLPERIVTKEYGTERIDKYELYTYDDMGNVITYTSPKAEDDTENTEYQTSYSYDSSYSMPVYSIYKQDADTTVLYDNTLTTDNKSIAESRVYVNSVLKSLTTYIYDPFGRCTSKTEYPDISLSNGITTSYSYTGANLTSTAIASVANVDGNTADITRSFAYDIMGRIIAETDANGNTTETEYDECGRVVAVTHPDGSEEEYTYDISSNTVTVEKSGKDTTVHDYDSFGKLESVKYVSDEYIKEYVYDARERLVTEITGDGCADGSITNYRYDDSDRLTQKTVGNVSSVLYKEEYSYDDAYTSDLTLLTKTIIGDGNSEGIVSKTYTNKYGEIVKEEIEISPGSISTANHYEYDYIGNMARSYYFDANENEVATGVYTYDYRGNVLSETKPGEVSRTLAYDAMGRKISESDFMGRATTYTYDKASRLIASETPFDNTVHSMVKYYYDNNGNVTKQLRSSNADNSATAAWNTVEYSYDEMNRVTDIATHITATDKEYTHYEYDSAGNMTDMCTGMTMPWSLALLPSAYSRTQYTYDGRGNLTVLTDPLGQTENYAYDVLGRTTACERRDGSVVRYTYDSLGNITSEKIYENDEATVPVSVKTNVYTATGALRSSTVDGSTVSYTYDGFGNVLTETEEHVVNSYTYDSRGRKSGYSLTVDGIQKSSATYAYDTRDRLISVTEGGVTTTYTYDANGNRLTQTTGNVSTSYTYNDANLVLTMTNSTVADGVPTQISAFAYTYYTDGNQRTKTDTRATAVTTAYVYDGAGRLKSETEGTSAIVYTYDARGNRVSMNNAGVITAYTYDANNRLLSETTGNATVSYTYDANGNTLTAGDKTYTYNARGQQTGYTDGTTTASYAYNPSGLRRSKTVGGATKYFIYNNGNIVYEYTLDASGNIIDGNKYYYGLNRTHNSAGEIYVCNAHGDTVQLVANGSVTVSYTYDAFGNLTAQTGTSANPFLYCSEYFDTETGTYYLRARYYNPANGRFTQQDAWSYIDPSDPLSLNLYTYCVGNPIIYIDILGNEISWNQVGQAFLIAALAAVTIAAIIATAGGAAAAVGTGIALATGASATTALTITTAATVGAHAVAGGVLLTSASDIGEVFSGHNIIRDDLMGGNQSAYDATRICLNIAGYCIVGLGSQNNVVPNSKEKKVPDKAYSVAKQIKLHNGAAPQGYKGGRVYMNQPIDANSQKLPEGIQYKEYDIYPYIIGQGRGAERLVIGSDGTVWYTDDHYTSFIKIE